MHADRLQPSGEVGAEQAAQFRHGEIEETRLALRLERMRVAAAEIDFDHRPPERTQMIGRGGAAVGVAEQPAVGGELVGTIERDEQLVGQPERQIGGGLYLRRQRRCEQRSRSRRSHWSAA